MKYARLKYLAAIGMVLTIWLSPFAVDSVRAQDAGPSDGPVTKLTVAVLPFVNNSSSIRAVRVIPPILDSTLITHGFSILPSDSLRNVLREYRIRTSGMINAKDGARIAEATGLEYLVVGSIDIFEENETPEIGLSVRILDLKTMQILWATTVGATGQDYVRLFGVGMVDSVDVLARRAIHDQLSNLSPETLTVQKRRSKGRTICAVIPCEDYSKYPKAGDIMSSLLVTELFDSGYDVIEPGVVNEIMITGRSQSRGKVDYAIMDLLKEKYNVKLIFTGSIDQFQAVRGNFDQASPEVSLGIRVLNASSHGILAAYDKERAGDYSESVFRLGGCHSLEKLTAGLLGNMIHTFTSHEGKEIADKN